MSIYIANIPSLILIFSSLLITSNSLYAWANRHSTGINHVMILSGNALWLLALGLRMGTREIGFYLDLNRLIFLSLLMMSQGIFKYTISFAGFDYWLGRRNLFLVSLVPLVGLLLFFTNSAHHLMWSDIQLYYISGITLSNIHYNPAFYIVVFYAILMLVVSMFLVNRDYRNSTDQQRRQVLILFFSVLSTLFAFFLYFAGLKEYPYFHVIFLFPSLLVTWGVWRYRLLDVAGIPSEHIIHNMEDAVLVLDRNMQVADANPAARRLAGVPLELEEHGRVLNLLNHFQMNLLKKIDATVETRALINLGTQEKPAYFDIHITPLYFSFR